MSTKFEPTDSTTPCETNWGDLSLGEIAALQNLARKKQGHDVGWISIADARSLTELGLAERSHQGWAITKAGLVASRALQEGDEY